MAFDSRKVHVGGIPPELCDEKAISLFFECQTFFPGGEVENVDLNLETRTAIVTFCDSEGNFL